MKEDRKLATTSGSAIGISAIASFVGLCCIGPWAFAIAVFGGALGCLLLLLRKSAAYYLFIASLLGVIVTMTHTLGKFGPTIDFSPFEILGIILMPLVLAAFLIWYSKQVENKGWIS